MSEINQSTGIINTQYTTKYKGENQEPNSPPQKRERESKFPKAMSHKVKIHKEEIYVRAN